MSDLWFNIFFGVYLLAGTTYMFLSPKDRQLVRLRKARPEWSEEQIRQFFMVSWLIMVGATIFVTYRLIEHLRGNR
jgi:uncharacterized membrane protein YfcA